MPREARKCSDLVANSNHLLYEIEMLAGAARLISGSARSTEGIAEDDRIRLQALIEARFMHARSLMRFLYPTAGARPDDMCAEDYVADGATLPAKWEGFDQDLKRIDQELAHLTYERSTAGAEWSFFPALTAALLEFVKKVAPDCVHMDFEQRALNALLNQTALARTIVVPASELPRDWNIPAPSRPKS
jgi:hypothetical protein